MGAGRPNGGPLRTWGADGKGPDESTEIGAAAFSELTGSGWGADQTVGQDSLGAAKGPRCGLCGAALGC